MMNFGLEIVPIGFYSDPRNIVELAVIAEKAGWQGIWLWDMVFFPYGAGDPWVSLAAAANATSKIKLITGVTPVPRYSPQILARMLSGLDILSQGRMIFGAGLGVASDYQAVGENPSNKQLSEMTDESLEIISRLFSGEKFSQKGKYYSVNDSQLVPKPIQLPRIPIWIGGDSNAALRRAGKWDGWIIGTVNEQQAITKTPEQIYKQVNYINRNKVNNNLVEIVVDGISTTGEKSLVGEYADAGATWWFECIFASRGTPEEMIKRVKNGPPDK